MHQAHTGKKSIELVVLFLGMLLLGCGVRAEPPTATPTQTTAGDRAASSPRQKTPKLPSKPEEECAAKGGWWKSTYPYSPMRPVSNEYSCELPNPKAGAPCKSSSECGGYSCVPRSGNAGARVDGQCDRFSSGYGCRTTVEKGELVSICTD